MNKFMPFRLSRLASEALPIVAKPNFRPWHVVSTPPSPLSNSRFMATAALSENDAWAVGNMSSAQDSPPFPTYTLIEHWNGKTWQIVTSPNQEPLGNNVLLGVVAVATDDVWAVGFSFPDANNLKSGQPLTMHWNGSIWKIVLCPTPPDYKFCPLIAVSAISTNDVWAVGYNRFQDESVSPLTEHWDGNTWTIVANPPDATASMGLLAVSAINTNDVWAVGDIENPSSSDGEPHRTLIEHWNGNAWKIVESQDRASESSVLLGISAIHANEIWAVGFSYDPTSPQSQLHTLVEHWNGQTWQIVSSPNVGWGLNTLIGVVAISAQNAWAVGVYSTTLENGTTNKPLVEHWDGSSWQLVPAESRGVTDGLHGIAQVPQTEKLWAVGQTRNESSKNFSTLAVFSGPDCADSTS